MESSIPSLTIIRSPPIQVALDMLVVALVAGALFGGALNVGEFWWTDEARHAMDGVWALDVMRDHPVWNLYDYTIRYFAQYPALGLNWYPPFFALIEAAVFSVFGISEFAARLTVLLFILAGGCVW